MRTCKLFDKYRDGEATAEERKEYETHLAACVDCLTKTSLINNLAVLLKQDQVQMPSDLSFRIARRAFQQNRSWDALVVDWLRPAPALAMLALVFVLSSILWLVTNGGRNGYSEYEVLMGGAETISFESRIPQIESDSELVVWLEQEAHTE